MPSTELAVPSLLTDLQQAGAITFNSLILTDPNISYDRAESLCRYFGTVRDSSNWWLGDLLIYLEAVLPDEMSQLSESLNVSADTRGRWMRVAERIPPDERHPLLSWSHHAICVHAGLGRDERRELLDLAAQEGWSKSRLQQEINEEKPEPETCICPTCHQEHKLK